MKSKILIRKADAYHPELIEDFVREALSVFNGKKPLFVMGDRVLLKPNLLRGFGSGRCVTTHPAVISAVCRVLKDLGINRIDISDSPALGSLPAVAEKAGYGDL
ncbi:MAG: DUF362 domain-containing protein, partial [Nitrospinaceae bacterium]|nr:DUF362 domain-containing protein [Nitrospinaceae bacterium]